MSFAGRIRSSLPGAFWPLWCVAALSLVMLLPSQLRLGVPFWRLPLEQSLQAPVMGAAFLAVALVFGAPRERRPHALAAIAVGLACFGAGFLLLRARPDVQASRVVVALSAVLGIVLAYLPHVLRRHRQAALLALAGLCAALVAIGLATPRTTPKSADGGYRVVATALNAIALSHQRGLVEQPRMDGGGIAVDGDGFLLVTGSGEMYRLDWEAGRDALRSKRLPLSPPMNHAEFAADLPPRPRADPNDSRADRPMPWEIFRATDIAIDHTATPARIYVAHMHWNREGKCMTMRVSWASLPEGPADPGAAAWKSIFESRPCLQLTAIYQGTESGGRLAWTRDRRLLLSLGDFGFNGAYQPPMLAQAADADYGKVLLLDLAGGREVFTLGHRNPQGLHVDRKGRIWETEHGPQGGDELNLLQRGRNYGWPYVTHGTEYGRTVWPVAPPADGKAYEEPVIAFTPAVAISNLIELGPAYFPSWNGDLLAASLAGQSLYRFRLSGDRVAYVEPIRVGRRVRDLAQGKDGRIVLWTDEDELIAIVRTARESRGVLLWGMCSRCHEASGGGAAPGPSLRGVAGNAVAAQPGYAYSPALKRFAGQWTDERLDAFLRNPAQTVPGTSMGFEGLPDADERRALIKHMKNYR